MNDYDDANDSAGYADLLSDLGFFVAVTALAAAFGGIVYYVANLA